MRRRDRAWPTENRRRRRSQSLRGQPTSDNCEIASLARQEVQDLGSSVQNRRDENHARDFHGSSFRLKLLICVHVFPSTLIRENPRKSLACFPIQSTSPPSGPQNKPPPATSSLTSFY